MVASTPAGCRICGQPTVPGPFGVVCPACLLHPALEDLPPPASGAEAAPERTGDRIGRYTLLEPLGEGGFGTVWLAEQLAPVSRQVALKILKHSMDTREAAALFVQERQMLALMDHPHIARVYDAGTTDAGRPYFVMELVRGAPVTEFCVRCRLPRETRMQIFLDLCSAVQHAHQRGIIHRDLKPSNLLVLEQDGQVVPKIIDFGIAKAVGLPLPERIPPEGSGRTVGTPAYMSPEQLDFREDVDTRSDIYSLGVLLYELLTDTPPFDPVSPTSASRTAAPEESGSPVPEPAPPRASARSGGKVGEDLDWIIAKCLKQDRALRYATVGDLAEDLRRHLNHEPVLARPSSSAYRLRKWTQRHKGAFAAGLLVTLALVAGTAASTWQMLRARSAEERALSLLAESTAAQDRLRRESYRSQIQLAHGRLDGPLAHTVPDLLRATDPALRGWEWGWLTARCPLPAWRMQTEGGPVRRMAMDTGGTRLFTASADGALRAWSVAERTLLWRQNGGEILDLAVRPGGAQLAVIRSSAVPQGRLAILDAATGEPVHQREETNAQRCVWEPRGMHLIVASPKELFHLDADTWKKGRHWPLEVIASNPRDLAMDVAGEQVALAETWDGPWLRLEARTLQPISRVPGPQPPRGFAAAWLDTQAGWEVCAFGRGLHRVSQEGEPAFSLIHTHPVSITHLTARDKDHLVVVGDDHLAEVRRDGTVARRERLPQRVTSLCADGEGAVFLGGEGGMVWRWDGGEAPPVPLAASCQIADPVGGRFLSFADSGRQLLMFRHARQEPFSIALEAGVGRMTEAGAPCPHDSTGKPTYRHTQGLPCRNPATGEVVTAGTEELLFHRRRKDGSWERRAMPVDGVPFSAAFDREGRFLLVATSRGASLHDLRARTVAAAPIPAEGGGLVDLTADGRLALLLHERRACVWETATGNVRLDRTYSARLVGALHPSGEVLALSARSREILLLPLRPGLEERSLHTSGRWPHVVRFSPDGERLYTAGPENKIWWFDWRLDKELLVLDETSNVTDVILSPDGRTLATCGSGVGAHLRTVAE